MSAAFRISPSLWEKIHHFASFPQTGGQYFVFLFVQPESFAVCTTRSGLLSLRSNRNAYLVYRAPELFFAYIPRSSGRLMR